MQTITRTTVYGSIYSLPQLATSLKANLRTIQRIRKRLNVGTKPNRDWLLTPADVAAIKAEYRGKGAVGNPNFVAGHNLAGPGRGKKKAKKSNKSRR